MNNVISDVIMVVYPLWLKFPLDEVDSIIDSYTNVNYKTFRRLLVALPIEDAVVNVNNANFFDKKTLVMLLSQYQIMELPILLVVDHNSEVVFRDSIFDKWRGKFITETVEIVPGISTAIKAYEEFNLLEAMKMYANYLNTTKVYIIRVVIS
jgi:hypothetical protein